MKPLYSKEQYENTKSNDLLPLECYQCGEQFYRLKNDIRRVGKKNKNGKNPPKTCKYCSHKCKDKSRTTKVTTICSHCGKQFQKHLFKKGMLISGLEKQKLKLKKVCMKIYLKQTP